MQYFYYSIHVYNYLVNVKILQEVSAKVTDFCKNLRDCGAFYWYRGSHLAGI
jgi:hypothetical protein